jgi:hypothetical protein
MSSALSRRLDLIEGRIQRLGDDARLAKAPVDYARLQHDLRLFALYGCRPQLDTPHAEIRARVAAELKNYPTPPTPETEDVIDAMTDDLANATEAEWREAQRLCNPGYGGGR